MHLVPVHRLTAQVGNLIMMNLQMARERVNQVETVWIKENFSFLSSSITRQLATAIPVRIMLMCRDFMSLCVSTRMLSMLKYCQVAVVGEIVSLDMSQV